MSLSAIQGYHNELASYKPAGFVPDTAATGPSIRPLNASELADIGEENPDFAANATAQAPGFGEMVKGFVKDVNDKVESSDEQTRELMTGKTHDTGAVVAGVEEADLALQFAIAFRSKIVNAYQSISQIQY